MQIIFYIICDFVSRRVVAYDQCHVNINSEHNSIIYFIAAQARKLHETHSILLCSQNVLKNPYFGFTSVNSTGENDSTAIFFVFAETEFQLLHVNLQHQ